MPWAELPVRLSNAELQGFASFQADVAEIGPLVYWRPGNPYARRDALLAWAWDLGYRLGMFMHRPQIDTSRLEKAFRGEIPS